MNDSSGRSGSHAGPSLRLKGNIKAEETFSIAGEFEGTIQIPKHEVSIAKGARVQADINAGKVLICGEVHGNVVGIDRVELTSTANMCGKLQTRQVRVQEGAIYRGEVDIIRDGD